MRYSHTEYGWLIFVFMGPIIAFLSLAYFLQWGSKPLPLIPFILLTLLFLVITGLFYKMKVVIIDKQMRVSYGALGLIRIKVDLLNLASVDRLKTPFLYGLGIRITPQGMLYNIHSLQAVKLHFSSGKNSIMIGSSDADGLMEVLSKLIAEKPTT